MAVKGDLNTTETGQDVRRKMTVEDALRWAYLEELPKAGAPVSDEATIRGWMMGGNASSGTEAVATWWCLPDNVFGVVVDPTAMDAPHPDAVAIHDAVMRLDACETVIPDGWDIAPELDGLEGYGEAALAKAIGSMTMVGHSNGTREWRKLPSQIIRAAAILGHQVDDLAIETPSVEIVRKHGKPAWFRRDVIIGEDGLGYEVELDGYNARTQRPYADAYQKHFLDPDPHDAICGRIAYELWRAAMDLLVDGLAELSSVRVMPSLAGRSPWMSETAAKIWPDLLTLPAARRAGDKRRFAKDAETC